jgi:hypothetical protein
MRNVTTTGDGFDERQVEGPLEDTASHMPLISHQSRLEGLVGLYNDIDLRQIVGSHPEGSNQQRQGVVSLTTTSVPVAMPTLHVDLTLIAHIVRVVIEAMPGASASTTLLAPIIRTTLVVTTLVDNMVTLVRTVKSMRELGCESFFGRTRHRDS